MINYTSTTAEFNKIMTFPGIRPGAVRVQEDGRTVQGLGTITYKITALKGGACLGYFRRSFSYNNHSDWGRKTLDGRNQFLGHNLTLDKAVERTLSL